MKHKFNEEIDHEPTTYEVVGAGHIKISGNPNSICGRRAGFSFGVSWSNHGIDCGGVLPREEARKLADRIYELLGECTQTEEEYYDEWQRKFLSGYD
jgi:hypothetical protein